MRVRVLLIDDDDDARAALADRLRRLLGIELMAAVRDDEGAARALMRTQPDVLLVDLHSRQDRDGVELCSELRGMAAAPMVVLASFMPRDRWQRLRAAGATDCLLKRVDGEGLERELVQAGARYRSERAALEAGERRTP